MFSHLLRTTLRTLRTRLGYVAINVVGLALGIAASILIWQYVLHEWSYDAFHTDADRIHRVRFDLMREGERLFKAATTYPAVGPAMAADFPEVEAQARLYLRYGGGVVRVGNRSFKEERAFHADSTVLTMFDYPWVRGDRTTALDAPHTVVLSERIARKYFGDADPLGEHIRFATDEEYTVTGVARSPETSHLEFDLLFSLATLEHLSWSRDPWQQYAWNWYDFYTYLQLAPGADPEGLEAKFPAFVERHKSEEASVREIFSLQPLRDIHLHSDLIQEAGTNGDATTVYVLALVAAFILIIAWVNYVNLATARAVERAREVGVRKTVGASRGQLLRQFLGESLLLNLTAVVLALALVQMGAPWFRDLVGVPVTVDLATNAGFWAGFGGLFLVGALVSGFYPALVLARYRPARVLKGTFARSTTGVTLRRGLVVGQFVASVGLIAGTLIVFQQLNFMQSQDLGIELDRMLVVEAPQVLTQDSLYEGRIQSFTQELERQSAIQHAAASTEVPGNLIYWTSGMRRYGAPAEASTVLYQVGIDDAYFTAYGHETVAGRAFRPDAVADTSRVILNEAAVRALGFAGPEDAVGKRIVGGPDTLEVAGVVADFHQEGLHRPVDPVGFRVRSGSQAYRFISLQVQSTNWEETLATVEATFAAFFPNDPFTYVFLDEHFDRQYQSYRRFGQVFGLFAGFAILVACLGLLGLSAFMAAQRTKEIGIRKAMGATSRSIVTLLTKDFLLLVLLGSAIAVPLVWIGMEQWLDGFAYRVSLRGGAFAVATLVVTVIALATIGVQAWRAARTDPARVLRSE